MRPLTRSNWCSWVFELLLEGKLNLVSCHRVGYPLHGGRAQGWRGAGAGLRGAGAGLAQAGLARGWRSGFEVDMFDFHLVCSSLVYLWVKMIIWDK